MLDSNSGAGGYSSRPHHYPRQNMKIEMTQTCWVSNEIQKVGAVIEVLPSVAHTLIGMGQAKPATSAPAPEPVAKKVAKKKASD
jgi:hypothetical protein